MKLRLGETLSQSIFAKGKRFGAIEMKNGKGKKNGNAHKQTPYQNVKNP